MIEMFRKYYLLLFLLSLSGLFGQNPETGWDYVTTTQQCFYIFETINIDDNVVVGDGSQSGDCYENFNTCDVVGAFIQRDETMGGECEFIGENIDDNEFTDECQDLNGDGELTSSVEVCVGWMYGTHMHTTVPLVGAEDDFVGYLYQGETPYLKVYDHVNGGILPLDNTNIYYDEELDDTNDNGIWG